MSLWVIYLGKSWKQKIKKKSGTTRSTSELSAEEGAGWSVTETCSAVTGRTSDETEVTSRFSYKNLCKKPRESWLECWRFEQIIIRKLRFWRQNHIFIATSFYFLQFFFLVKYHREVPNTCVLKKEKAVWVQRNPYMTFLGLSAGPIYSGSSNCN